MPSPLSGDPAPVAPAPASPRPSPAPPARQLPAGSGGAASQAGDLLGRAQTWIEQNQTVAMAAAFALGTFLGVWMRR
jgi:hypothetical protein